MGMCILKTVKAKVAIVILVVSMVLGMTMINAEAAKVETNTQSTTGSTYNYYVRKAGNSDLLGVMTLSMTKTYVKNVFKAAVGCSSVSIYVSETSYLGIPNTFSIPQGQSQKKEKKVSNPKAAYGKVSDTYK